MTEENAINIDLSKPCSICGKLGAAPNGYCLACIVAGVKAGRFDHVLDPLRKQKPKRRKTR